MLMMCSWHADLPEEWPSDQGEDAEAYAALLVRVKAAQRKRDALQAQKAQYEVSNDFGSDVWIH